MEVDSKNPNPIDLHVGARIRMRRKFFGLSQEDLAKAIDLTFQQVQKYERGSNRVSASKLYAIALTLKAPVAYFFEGYNDGEPADAFSESASEQFVHGFLMTTEGIELAEAFPRINNAKHRRKILDLVRTLAEDEA
ncbi:helix-turn-helix domain-containing protein [Asticcacaulis benevestitus]|uniref:Cro/Cl family transcriptional regulator n=1 Tax=Asticcacaulis benevestitus DSM 16100 = ATCC BAA-896 TaxID=1121022 RepID=V4PEX4_9CAUL|nr:helix-turn-helix transcriptional regulator [Asticcacaulis benevestitus]ESQ92507.1 Cro/Cl family transcriptional regulator [Asticcacaulis benevestitus DSM 16100 = ATCC BAA-896]